MFYAGALFLGGGKQMNNHLKSIAALGVIFLLGYTFFTVQNIYRGVTSIPGENTPKELTTITTLTREYKELLSQGDAKEPTEIDQKIHSPFYAKKAIKKKEPVEKKIDFDRVPLTLKGIMTGKRTIVLLKERSGKTHPLSQGESVHERKIIKITSSSVILEDKLGRDTLLVE